MNYSRKMKPLLDKIEETCKMINSERTKCGIALSDDKGLAAWESNMKLKGNTLTEFHKTWVKINEQKIKQKQIDKINVTLNRIFSWIFFFSYFNGDFFVYS